MSQWKHIFNISIAFILSLLKILPKEQKFNYKYIHMTHFENNSSNLNRGYLISLAIVGSDNLYIQMMLEKKSEWKDNNAALRWYVLFPTLNLPTVKLPTSILPNLNWSTL
jgi:hypothetical protein